MKKRAHLTHLKRKKRLIEEEGYLQDCWIAQYQPAGTAKGDKKYYHLRSRFPQFSGKKSKHLKAHEIAHYQKLIDNGRELKTIERQLQKLTYRISQREALTSNESNEWYTPPAYIELARQVMGDIDLDPASHPFSQAILLLKPAVGSSWYQRLSAQFPRCEPHKRIRFINAQGITQTSPVHGNTFMYLGADISQFVRVFGTIGNVAFPFVGTL